MLEEFVRKNRSYRRFQSGTISRETLLSLVNLARLSASGANKQPLKYYVSQDAASNETIFQNLTTWAGMIKDWRGPEAHERPSGYIVMLLDKRIAGAAGIDAGIAAQSITLGAVEQGYAACILGSVKRSELAAALKLDARFEILYVIAIGKPGEQVVLEEAEPESDCRYYRDADGVHHVPKRSLAEVVVN